MSNRAAKVIILLLLVLGVQLWLIWGRGLVESWVNLAAALACFAVALVPQVRRKLSGAFGRVRHPSPPVRGIVALGITVASAVYLYATAAHQGRTFQPRFHDEFMCLLQARMLSVGRLWMPPLPHGDFFDTFYVFVEPVYASLTWPGASMMYVPGMWLSLPYWVMPLVISGAAVGLMYSVIAQLLDGVLGLAASLTLVATRLFRMQGLQTQAQVPILMLALLFVWAWLRWRASPSLRNALFLGLVAGWTAITRPVDALCVAIPIAVAMTGQWWRLAAPLRWKTAGAVVAGAAPFLALQLVFNTGVTGSLTKTPFTHYNERDQPMLQFGFPKYDGSLPQRTKLLQKQLHYRDFVLPQARLHVPSQIPGRIVEELESMEYNLPHPLLLAFLPAGLTGWFKGQRYAVWGALPLFVALYALYTLYLPHYALVVAPVVIFTMLAGMCAAEQHFPAAAPAFTVLVAGLCVGVLPELNRHKPDAPRPMVMVDFSMADLPRLVQTPALVMFKFVPALGVDVHEEPVYNIDTAWPDDAPIIRAHDLGPEKNVELLRHYAERQPDRRVYMIDRRDLMTFRYIGRAGQIWEIVQQSATRPSTLPAATTRSVNGRAP